MPQAPSKLRILPATQDDIATIQQRNPDDAERILRKIKEWEEHIQWGRVPQNHLRYLTGSGSYNFYRQRIGNSAFRVVYEISNDLMTAVAAFPKDDNAYDLDEFCRRMDRL